MSRSGRLLEPDTGKPEVTLGRIPAPWQREKNNRKAPLLWQRRLGRAHFGLRRSSSRSRSRRGTDAVLREHSQMLSFAAVDVFLKFFGIGSRSHPIVKRRVINSHPLAFLQVGF